MAKRGRKSNMENQMDLISVGPENAKKIIKHAKLYEEALAVRQKSLKQEIKEKTIILELVGAAKLQRLEDGKIKFRSGQFQITITPRDELLQIKNTEKAKEAETLE